MKLFSPGGPGLSAIAKPRLGDTDQRACARAPTPAKTIKPHRPDGSVPWTSSGIEVSRKFAEPRRTSLFPRRAEHGGGQGEARGAALVGGRKEVQGGKRSRRTGEEGRAG